MDGLAIAHPDVVRRLIAGEWLRAETVAPGLGAVTLRRHQLDAVERLRILLARTGGALLCDDVGLGKTFVALAVARSHARTIVVAPASLREMWLAAAKQAAVAIRFVSSESLSRTLPPQGDHRLVIVDEAHHFRTPGTARYRSLAALTARSRTLLLSATPVHNKAADVTALLSLFLGSAARTLSEGESAKYVVRRNQSEIPGAFPLVHPPVRVTISDDSQHLRLLLALPPPTPARDGRVAAAMVAHTLVRLWASSGAALREGLRRRLAKTVAIRHSLESGHYPTRRELDTWTYGEGAVQLGFAEILAPEKHGERASLLDAVREHESALTELLSSLPRESCADSDRAEHIRALRRRHPGAKVVAFSQFAQTVSMYYRRLASDSGIAMLTSRGARVAGGAITRTEALARFAPIAAGIARPSRAEDISLLVATDLLSEGVNLQDASVVVHLDLPWTAATLMQRVGRIARLGSRNREVTVYAIDPPASSKDLVRAETIIRRKAGLMEAGIGASTLPPLFARAEPTPRSPVEDAEAIRRALARWVESDEPVVESRNVYAAITAERDGVLALVDVRGTARLIAGNDPQLSADAHSVCEVVELAHGSLARVSSRRIGAAVQAVRRWIECELASADAGQSDPGPTVLARQVSARLAQHLSSRPRHAFSQYAARIAAVHNRLQAPLTIGIEGEITDLLRADQGAHEFLGSLEQIVGARCGGLQECASGIRAMLILERTESPK